MLSHFTRYIAPTEDDGVNKVLERMLLGSDPEYELDMEPQKRVNEASLFVLSKYSIIFEEHTRSLKMDDSRQAGKQLTS